MGNRASTIADMYSYGILLLEMFTGKRPTDNVFKDDLNLHILVESALPDQVLEIVDPRILSEHEPRSWLKDNLVSVLRIGVACSMESPRDQMQIQDHPPSMVTRCVAWNLKKEESDKTIDVGVHNGTDIAIAELDVHVAELSVQM
ncbi:hypothetical protein ACSBR1_015269 [Camellia fascicularis]